jgi:peptide chain release factor 3
MELMDEIETALGIEVVPFTWPVGMGKSFAGVIDIANSRMRMFKAGEDRVTEDSHAVVDIHDPALKERLGADLENALAEVDLIKEDAGWYSCSSS